MNHPKRNTGTILLIIGIICVLVALFFVVRLVMTQFAPRATLSEAYAPVTPAPEAEPVFDAEAEPDPEDVPDEVATENLVDDKKTIDFASLQEINGDIYGWLEIPNTDISFPVVQSATDDEYYLNHNSDGVYSANGAVYSEHEYNAKNFFDPVIILYGHHMSNGAIFGNLQETYTDEQFLADNPTFTIYTPDGELTYGVFACVPYSSDHILYHNDFTDELAFYAFFDGIMNTRDLSARFVEEYAPDYGDNVVILSTCRIGNRSNRFLVMGKLLTDQ